MSCIEYLQAEGYGPAEDFDDDDDDDDGTEYKDKFIRYKDIYIGTLPT